MNQLLDDIAVLDRSGDPARVEVRDVHHDHRLVGPGDLFCCLRGSAVDGHDFAPAAVAAGAVGLLCDHLLEGLAVPQAAVAPDQLRSAMAAVAAAAHGHPADDLVVVGVTGTNGKTTVTQLLGRLLGTDASGPATVIGTLTGARTTPESTELQRALAQVRDTQGPGAAVAMEVSSHALVQSRVDAVTFAVAAFTNLSHDHLDYHGTMDDYFAAKARLFEPGRARLAVVNAEDPWGARLLERLEIPAVAVHADLAAEVALQAGRSTFTWRGQPVELPLSGRINVDNAVLAAEIAVSLGHEPAEVAARLAGVPPVPGRLDLVADAPFAVFVDYAHTPAGLEVVLAEARRLAQGGRVICVFGCGGDRDRAKRPLMGAAAVAGADVAVLTSDNPRHEDPLAIIEAVRAGDPAGRLVVEPDRRAAIALALGRAGAGDVVVVAGKGHETTQQLGDALVAFDDRLVVADLLGGD